MAGEIGRRRHHRAAEGVQDRLAPPGERECGSRRCRGRRSRARPPRSRRVFGSTRVSGPGQNASRERCRRAHRTGRSLCGREIGDMGDQRIEGRAALGLVETGDRGRRWWRRRRAHRPSRSGTRPARRRRACARPRLPAGLAGGKISGVQARCHGFKIPPNRLLAVRETRRYKPRLLVGVWLSPVEHCVRDAGVAGSNPATPTIPASKLVLIAGGSQVNHLVKRWAQACVSATQFASGGCLINVPRENEGAGNAGRLAAPAASRTKVESTRVSHHRSAETHGIPCAMAYGL